MTFDSVAYKKKWAKKNHDKIRGYTNAWKTKNAEKISEWRRAHREEINARDRELYAKRSKEKRHESARAWYHRNKESQNIKAKARNKARRMTALHYYSNGTMTCECCPASSKTPVEFLCIDHTDKRPRGFPKLGGGGYSLYIFLEKNSYPAGFRVLCHNCNMSLGFYGYCPHQRL